MKEAYPTTSVSLVPDIVLSLDTTSYVSTTNGKREGMALVLRQDAERNLTMEDWAMIHDVVSQSGMKVTQMDTMADAKYIALEDRHDVVAELLSRFASSKVVVTDRLHGMIFAAITGTPCVAFANSNRKVGGVYQWINDLPYIQYINDTRQLEESLQAVLSADTGYPRMRIMKEFHSLIAALH
ncbi:polysaccharide pyruvyl transferase [Bifidobacterium pseudolongum subsp. globosum]|nr:polysaccharide pyruvyl transferase [Bifidobacterium pseudolongum subsp. globosum]RYQ77416.1 polysaccharide pyruvyl transferase [Bifidobacterium pseudolongum subsp. globosum]